MHFLDQGTKELMLILWLENQTAFSKITKKKKKVLNAGHFLNEYYGFHKHIEVYNRKTDFNQ